MPRSSRWNNEHDYSIVMNDASFQPHSTDHLTSKPGLATDSNSVNAHEVFFTEPPHISNPNSGIAYKDESSGAKSVSPRSQWGIHWKSPALMLSLFVFGILAGIAHHIYYQSLHDTNVESTTTQQWAIRIGTGLAFLAKAALAASVGVAFSQRIWVTLRSKPVSLHAMDDLFSLTVDPTSFFSWEIISKAKVLCLLAASMWCIPLVATITPATLSVHLEIMHNTTDVLVPYLDWSSSKYYAKYEGAGFISGASIPVHRVVAATATAGDIIQVAAHYSNSSYELEFFGPSLKCYNLSDAAERQNGGEDVASLQEMFDKTMDVPSGFVGPLIWLGNTTLDMDDTVFINIGGTKGQNLTCNLWNTTYHVLFNFTATEQSTTITHLNKTAAVHVTPGDVPTAYTASQVAYSGYSAAIRSILAVQIGISAMGTNNNPEAFLLKTSLASCPELMATLGDASDYIDTSQAYMCRNASIARAIEDLSHNFTLSLMSSELLAGNTTVGVSVFTPTNKYVYNWRNLVAAYGAGVVVALVGVCVGAFSYYANGYSASMSFSSILVTTRNADLDRLVEGRCLPAQPLGKGLGKTELRYGLLRSDGRGEGYKHAAFGFRETINDLKKGMPCA